MIKKTSLFIAFLVLTTVSAFSQGKYPSILWEIKKTPTSKPSYLFGTYHISDKGVFKMGDSIFYALKNVDMVATEVNDNIWQQGTAMFDSMKNGYSFYSDRFSGSFISEGTLRKTNSIPKLPVFISYQPGAINYFLYRNTNAGDGFEEEAFLDRFISSAGYKNGKKIAGLENIIESEIKMIEGEKDEALLDKEENKKLPDGLSEELINDMIFNGYKNNSLDMMDSLNKYTYSSEAYYKKFLIARNFDQADSLDYYIRQGNTVFAAVGAAHLPGAEGVIAIMRQKGYRVRPVKLSGHDKASIDALKKKKVPVFLQKDAQEIDGGISFRAPGTMSMSFANALLKIYSYVDMANGAYYMVSRMYNNSLLFGKSESHMIDAIDSLLYDNIEGEIISKNKTTSNGYPALDVVAQLKNKDQEKYRFIVTPYEAIKIKTGGKNDYTSLPVVDSFFNSFTIHQENKIKNNTGVTIPLNEGNWHTWDCGVFEEATVKSRYSNYDKAKKVMNGCIKFSTTSKELNPDSWYHKMAAESIVSSFALQKDESKKLDLSADLGNKVRLMKLESGGTIAVKTVLRHPYLYLLYSATQQGQPDTNWIAQTRFSLVESEHRYAFTDTMRGFSVKLPYAMNFDPKWKAAKERKTDKPDPDKEINRNSALRYYSKDVYNSDDWDSYTFQHPESLDIIWGSSLKLDSNLYYPDASTFWKPFIPKPYVEPEKENPTVGDNKYNSGSDNEKGYRLNKASQYISQLKYDTSSGVRQQISFIKGDSLSNRAIYHTIILNNDRMYYFQSMVSAPDFTPAPFFKKFMESFNPVNNNAAYNVYTRKLSSMATAFTKAPDMMAKSDVAERLNHLHLNISNLAEIESAMKQLKEHKNENNILRKKLVEIISESDMNPANWPVISNWLKKIYHDENELLTIRLFAVSQIMQRHDERDLGWVMENASVNPDFRSSELRGDMVEYFRKLKNKEKSRPILPLNAFGKGFNTYSTAFSLYDSGYFKSSELKESFNDIVKLVQDENSSIRLKAEGEYFKFPEKSDKKNLTDLRYDDNFRYYTSMFSLFYAALPEDSFFINAFPKIIKDGTPNDKLELIKVFAKQKKLPEDWTRQTLKSLASEKTLYLDIYKIFLYYNKEQFLPEEFRNKTDIALSFLKQQGSYYSKYDTVYFVNSKPSPYTKGETFYFFKFRKQKEKNEEVAYVLLTENMSAILSKKPVKFKLTDEQVVPGETMESISARLMRRHYINFLYDDNSDSDFYLEDKDEKSLDISE
ncbi:MAG: TraB/GumN family protein [Bacteroidetes bacterium]|nr:TraB/GumN family protein [Bacteroidota bacterium]